MCLYCITVFFSQAINFRYFRGEFQYAQGNYHSNADNKETTFCQSQNQKSAKSQRLLNRENVMSLEHKMYGSLGTIFAYSEFFKAKGPNPLARERKLERQVERCTEREQERNISCHEPIEAKK